VGAGVIDPDYTGEVKVVLFNHGENDFEVKKGDRIAQLILERCETPPIGEIINLVKETERGSSGFGSTGN
jgi:dUTP pyrophosphatase